MGDDIPVEVLKYGDANQSIDHQNMGERMCGVSMEMGQYSGHIQNKIEPTVIIIEVYGFSSQPKALILLNRLSSQITP